MHRKGTGEYLGFMRREMPVDKARPQSSDTFTSGHLIFMRSLKGLDVNSLQMQTVWEVPDS